jgi:hypothetical protein
MFGPHQIKKRAPGPDQRAARLRGVIASAKPATLLSPADLQELLSLLLLDRADYVAGRVTPEGINGRKNVELLGRDGSVAPDYCLLGVSLVVYGCPPRHQVEALGGWSDSPRKVQIPSAELHCLDEADRLGLALARLAPDGRGISEAAVRRLGGFAAHRFAAAADELVERGLAERVEVDPRNGGQAAPGIRLTRAALTGHGRSGRAGGHGPAKRHDPEAKRRAIERYLDGEPLRQIALDVGAHPGSVRRWARGGGGRRPKRTAKAA